MPEILRYVDVFAVNLKAMTRAKLPRLFGSDAQKPPQQPGAGVNYYKAIVGDPPSRGRIMAYIDSVLKH